MFSIFFLISLNKKVKSDALGRMEIKDLKRAISDARKSGLRPFMVIATCATTVLGAIDPLDEIADVCKEENLWMHVDVSLASS